MSMKYGNTKYLVYKCYFLVQKSERKTNTQNLRSVQNMNKGKKSIENSSPLYRTYTPTVI